MYQKFRLEKQIVLTLKPIKCFVTSNKWQAFYFEWPNSCVASFSKWELFSFQNTIFSPLTDEWLFRVMGKKRKGLRCRGQWLAFLGFKPIMFFFSRKSFLNACFLFQASGVFHSARQKSFLWLLTDRESNDGKTHKFEMRQNFREMVYFSCIFRFRHVG